MFMCRCQCCSTFCWWQRHSWFFLKLFYEREQIEVSNRTVIAGYCTTNVASLNTSVKYTLYFSSRVIYLKTTFHISAVDCCGNLATLVDYSIQYAELRSKFMLVDLYWEESKKVRHYSLLLWTSNIKLLFKKDKKKMCKMVHPDKLKVGSVFWSVCCFSF